MTEAIDQRVLDWLDAPDGVEGGAGLELPADEYLALFDAQLQSRHLDFAARWLQSQGFGFYTIGSAGHESNAAVAMALRPTDPALLHYRSGAFYAARAAQVPGTTPIRDVLLGMTAGAEEPASGGRHKVFGNHRLAIIPQTSTIGSHLPRAFGIAFALGHPVDDAPLAWPADSVVVATFGDASANHSTVTGAVNAAAYCAHRELPLPLLLVCEDNGIGISVRTPERWIEAALSNRPGMAYFSADGDDPTDALTKAREAAAAVRERRRPAILHLKTVRLMGHAGSDAEIGYRSQGEIVRDYARDPLLATARLLVAGGILTAAEVRQRYERVREDVMAEAAGMRDVPRLASTAAVMRPLTATRPDAVRAAAAQAPQRERRMLGRTAPEEQGPLTLAQSINAALGDVLATFPQATVFGEDVGRKGGVYGVTRGLAKRFGRLRVFDTLLDEQTILGTALGAALSGLLPIPEIQYLAYVHNAEDQLRGEAATLRFFSDGAYANGMVVRIAGLAYQKGFGGHFHNDNSVAALRDIPGIVLAVPAHPAHAPALLRTCAALAQEEGRVCVFLEPIALYHTRDLYAEGDGLWTATYEPPGSPAAGVGEIATHRDGDDLLIVTFGNGVPMSLRAAAALEASGIDCTVADLRWLQPLPIDDLLSHARRFSRVLVVDETRRTGGVSEGVVTALIDHGYDGAIRRVASHDSLVPLGPAAYEVLLGEEDIVTAAGALFPGAARPVGT
ncbi:MAG TPA: thiamine pyrophosphate-dependent enzyme [Solirubrobacter sp.]|nr:thiamine pyrophosphate-dependent enzyme [Solirubrobacter sp.]